MEGLIASMGYPGLAFLMALDATILPVPSGVVLGFAGFLCYEGRFDIAMVALTGAMGSTVGSISMYALSYYGGRPFLDRFGRYLGLRGERLSASEAWFRRYGGYAVFLSQLLPIVRDLMPFPAGVARMAFWRFALFSFLGSVLFCLALASIGFLSGPMWESAVEALDKYDIFVLVGFLLLVAGLLAHKAARRRAKRGRSDEGTD